MPDDLSEYQLTNDHSIAEGRARTWRDVDPFPEIPPALNSTISPPFSPTAQNTRVVASRMTETILRAFLSQLVTYRQQRRDSVEIYTRFDGDMVFLELIETMR